MVQRYYSLPANRPKTSGRGSWGIISMTQLKMVGSICLYIPLGGFTQPTAWRKSLSGVLDGPATPIFWNIDKSE
jgi:hypothetical protein